MFQSLATFGEATGHGGVHSLLFFGTIGFWFLFWAAFHLGWLQVAALLTFFWQLGSGTLFAVQPLLFWALLAAWFGSQIIRTPAIVAREIDSIGLSLIFGPFSFVFLSSVLSELCF